MTAGLRQAAADYLKVRRSLGYKMARPEKLLGQFIGYLEQAGVATVTTEHALAWSVLPGGDASWHAAGWRPSAGSRPGWPRSMRTRRSRPRS